MYHLLNEWARKSEDGIKGLSYRFFICRQSISKYLNRINCALSFWKLRLQLTHIIVGLSSEKDRCYKFCVYQCKLAETNSTFWRKLKTSFRLRLRNRSVFFFFLFKIKACVFYTYFNVHSFFLWKCHCFMLLMDFLFIYIIFVIFEWNVH